MHRASGNSTHHAVGQYHDDGMDPEASIIKMELMDGGLRYSDGYRQHQPKEEVGQSQQLEFGLARCLNIPKKYQLRWSFSALLLCWGAKIVAMTLAQLVLNVWEEVVLVELAEVHEVHIELEGHDDSMMMLDF